MSYRARLRPIKRALAPAVELIWRGAFAVAGKLGRSTARRWSSPGRQHAMVIAPHPDDEAIGCGGTVLRHVAAGDSVTLAIATDGRRAGGMASPDLMAERRQAEATHAAALLGATRFEWIGLPEGEWPIDRLRGAFATLLAAQQPDIVYAPSRVDFHPEHHNVAHALALALESIAPVQPPLVRVYQIQVPLTGTLVNLVSDLASVLAPSEAALRAHASQSGSVECTYRRRRYSASLHGFAGAAEEFWEMPAGRYIDMHRDPPASWRDHYRGLRNFPLTDPLAWLVGADARRNLRGSALNARASA